MRCKQMEEPPQLSTFYAMEQQTNCTFPQHTLKETFM